MKISLFMRRLTLQQLGGSKSTVQQQPCNRAHCRAARRNEARRLYRAAGTASIMRAAA